MTERINIGGLKVARVIYDLASDIGSFCDSSTGNPGANTRAAIECPGSREVTLEIDIAQESAADVL